MAILVLAGCLLIPGFAQTTLTTPLDEQQIRTPLPKEGTSPAVDPRGPVKSHDPNHLESAPGKDKDRLPGLPETLAVPETAAPWSEFQEFVASSLGRKLPIYGYSLFDRVPTTFAPVDRIPVTGDYVIGPGDEVLIRAWGQIDLDGKLVVDRDGEVFLPKVGALAVAGLKYQQLPEFFRTAIGRVFRNFDLTVSLGQLRSIQVFVVGQARHPGNYTVSSLSTLVNALFASGGPSGSGSMRRIQLKRNNLVVTEFDFYGLLLKGDKSKDARLLPGDVIYIPPTGPSIASASCAVAVGARPVIADVDRDSQNLTADTIRAVLTRKTKAIVAVHLAGWPCEMDEITDLARQHGLKVVEDCAQAQGARYKGRPIGSLGNVAAFSFCQDKIMTTGGEGGMLTTNDENLWQRAWSRKDHGKSLDAMQARQPAAGFRWLHDSFGTNWRMTEMQSAIGRIVLRKVPDWLTRRRRFASVLNDNLAGLTGLRISHPRSEIDHAYYKYYAFVRPEALRPGWNRDRIMQAINAQGVPCSVGSCSEIYLEKAFMPELGTMERLPIAKELGETSLMFMVHPTLSDEHIRDTYISIQKVMQEAGEANAFRSAAAASSSASL